LATTAAARPKKTSTASKLREDPAMPELVLSSPDQFFEMCCQRAAFPGGARRSAAPCQRLLRGPFWRQALEPHGRKPLLAAEKFSALAERVTGQPYSKEFERAWKNVLFNQFHDILAGTSLEVAYDDARDQYGEAMSIADRALNMPSRPWPGRSMSARSRPDPDCRLQPARLGMSRPTSRSKWAVNLKGEEILVDDEDRRSPSSLSSRRPPPGGRYRLSFIADLPALGTASTAW
jgi:alpha-mannosidase